MKKAIWLVLLVVLVAGVSVAQLKYIYEGPFPDTTGGKKIPFDVVNGGIWVDPAGKVWVQAYSNSLKDSIEVPASSGTYTKLRPVYVFNADGTPASFSPIKFLTGPDQNGVIVTDTLFARFGYGGGGDPADGNAVFVWGSKSAMPGILLWEIDYKTGTGVRRILNPTGIGTSSPAGVAVNQDGDFYFTCVAPNLPAQIFGSDGTAGTQIASGVAGYARMLAVSKNGNDVYLPRFGDYKNYIYHSDNGSFGPYALTDSFATGTSVESIAIHPVTGHVWFSVDRRSTNGAFTKGSFYAYNPSTKAIVDSFSVQPVWDTTATGPLPRGMAFSPTGDTLYLGHFDTALPVVIRYILGPATSVEQIDGTIPSGYGLEQNYPNPFNPSTEIRFTIASEGMATITVFDMLGREVSTLMHEFVPAGSYRTTFNAAGLPSGTYIYRLTANGVAITKRMTLLK